VNGWGIGRLAYGRAATPALVHTTEAAAPWTKAPIKGLWKTKKKRRPLKKKPVEAPPEVDLRKPFARSSLAQPRVVDAAAVTAKPSVGFAREVRFRPRRASVCVLARPQCCYRGPCVYTAHELVPWTPRPDPWGDGPTRRNLCSTRRSVIVEECMR
jgi:hypothetical protein